MHTGAVKPQEDRLLEAEDREPERLEELLPEREEPELRLDEDPPQASGWLAQLRTPMMREHCPAGYSTMQR
jgi:hypothetical protein